MLSGAAAISTPAGAQFRSLENPSFESNDPAGPGAPNFQVLPDTSVPGWATTTAEIELWDSNYQGVPAYEGLVFAEMNANNPGTFYQNICLVNGEPIGWTFAHRARSGGPATQTVRFQIATATGTLIQTLATQNSTTSNLVWNVNTGTATYTGATGLQRVQFNTTNTGSVGNFLDAIQLTLRPFVQLSAGTGSGIESVASSAIPTLRITGRATSAIAVNMSITGGTATRGSDYTTPGGGASFTVTIPAGTYNNTAIPLGITIIDDTAVEGNETITFSLAAGTGYTLGNTTTCGGALQSTGSYTITDNDSRVRLQKQWSNAIVGDQANLTIFRGATAIDTLASIAGTANELDSDPSPTAVTIGETLTLSETFPGSSNAATYSGAVQCTGAADTDLSNGLTIGTGETSIVCTYTNTRIVPLLVNKSSFVLSDPVNPTVPKAIPGGTVRYCIFTTNPGTLAATNVVAVDTLPSEVTYIAGSARTGADCNSATMVEDENSTGADESDPYGFSLVGSTITVLAATLAAGASFAFRFDAIIN